MPALSKKQQKFMGIVRSIQKGEQPASKFNKDAQDVAKDMKKKDVKKFASTKHKGLPMKKEVLNKLKEMIKQELSEYTYGSGDIVKDVNPTCPHYGAEGKVKSVNPKSVVFVVMNKGKNFKPGMELEKSHDQMKKIDESLNENRDFEKLYNLFTKKDYFNLKNSIKQMLRNYDVALKKGDKGAQKYTKQDVIKSVTAQNKENAKRVYDELVTAIKKKDIRRLKSRLRYNQPYSMAIFNQITGKKLPKTTRDIHSFLDNEFMKESVKESMNPSAVKKMRDEFEKTGELPPHLKKFAKDLNAMKKKHKVKNIVVPGLEWMSDMKENINEDGHTDVASSKRKVMIMVDDSNKLLNKLNGMNKEDSLPSWWTDKITLSQKYLEKATNYLLNPVESVNEDVFAIVDKFNQSKQDYDQVYFKDNNLNKVKNHLKKLGKKYGKMNLIRVKTNGKMSLVESVNEFRDKREANTALDQIGPKALYMIGAKDYVFGNSGGKKSLVFKIMRNSKGVSHIRMRLTSLDLYDMEFLAIRAGKIKVKSKEKGVYGDTLRVMIKKNTGLNVRL